MLRDINGRLVQYDFRLPAGDDTLNDIDFDGTDDVQGTVTLWVRRPLVGGADYVDDDRIILTAEGTAPGGQGIGAGRNVAMRRLYRHFPNLPTHSLSKLLDDSRHFTSIRCGGGRIGARRDVRVIVDPWATAGAARAPEQKRLFQQK